MPPEEKPSPWKPTSWFPHFHQASSPPPESEEELAGGMAAGVVQRVLTLRTFPAYREMPPEQLAVIAEYSRERRFRTGEHLLREGRPVTSIFFVITGRVELRRRGRPLRALGERSVVGGLSAFAKDPEGYDCVARKETVALEISAEDSLDIFEDHFPLLKTVLRGLAREFLDARRKLGPTAGFKRDASRDCECPPRALDLVERMARLRESISFAHSRLDAIGELAREAVEERHEAGDVLFEEGDRGPCFYLVVAGGIDGDNAAGQRFGFGPGDTVGSLDAVGDVPRWFTARVSKRAVLLRIDLETIFDVFEDHFDMAMDLIAAMATGILAIYDELASDTSDGDPQELEGLTDGESLPPPAPSS